MAGGVPAKEQPKSDSNSKSNSKLLIASLIGAAVLALAVFLYLLGKKNGADETSVSAETVVSENKDDKVVQNKGKEAVEDVIKEAVLDVTGDYWGTVAGMSVELEMLLLMCRILQEIFQLQLIR